MRSPLLRTLMVLLAVAAAVGAAALVSRAVRRSDSGPAGVGNVGSGGPLRVVVSIAPLKGLVQPLLPAGSTIEILIPPGVSEHGYEPTADRLAALAQADLVVLVGMGLDSRFESFLESRPRAGRRVIEFAAVVAREIPAEPHGQHKSHAHDAHDHDDDHDHHDHGGGDPHLWLDPVLARALTVAVGGELKTPAPELLRALDAIDALIADYRRRLDPGACPERTIVVAHDAYGWLARRFDLRVVAIAGLTAAEPTAQSIAAAAAALRDHRARAVFLEPQISPAAASRLAAETGVPRLTLDPLGDGDYFALMQRNLDALVRGMGCAEPVSKPPGGTK